MRSYPLFGPLGAKKGHTIPTTAHRTVNTTMGMNEKPILRFYLENNLNYFISTKHQLKQDGGLFSKVGISKEKSYDKARFVM